jgi:hypothetical protein
MARQKGPGAIRFLDATKHDDVAMRRRLWRGDHSPTPQEKELEELYSARAKLTVELIDLRPQREYLRQILNGKRPLMERAFMRERTIVESKINAAETALCKIEKRIEETRKPIEKQIEGTLKQIKRRSRQRKAVFPWQEKAVHLIMLHKMLHKSGAGSVVMSTQGTTMPTAELQNQLRAEGFKVSERKLRKFMHDQCGVIGQQGKRTDLTSANT